MQTADQRILKILLENGVLKFGEFTTKAGRQSPYFFNAGNIADPLSLEIIAGSMAGRIHEFLGGEFEGFYGPAYKGIPLCVAVSLAFRKLASKNLGFTFNRKEAKDHGEGGSLVGRNLLAGDRVVITEDVLSAGTSMRESLSLMKERGVKVAAACVIVDRQERGQHEKLAREELESEFGVSILSLLTLDSIVAALWNQSVGDRVWIDDETKSKIDRYRSEA